MPRTMLLLPLFLFAIPGCQDPATPVSPPDAVLRSMVGVAAKSPVGVFQIVRARNVTWSEALAAATSFTIKGEVYASHLASPGTIQQAFEVFLAMRQGQECWIGASQDVGMTGLSEGWRWADGENWNYAGFTDNDPNDGDGIENGEENVAAAHDFRTGTGWHDLPGTTRLDCYVVELDQPL